MQLSHLDLIAGVMIAEMQLFLNPAALVVSLIVTAPYPFHVQILKGMPEHFPAGFRHDAPSPIGNPKPVTQFAFLITAGQIAVELQADGPDGQIRLFPDDGIVRGIAEELVEDDPAFLFTAVSRPAGRCSHPGIAGIAVELGGILRLPVSQLQSFRFKYHLIIPLPFTKVFPQHYYFISPVLFNKAVLPEKPDSRIIDGNVVIQNFDSGLAGSFAEHFQSPAAVTLTAQGSVDDHICRPDLSLFIIMICHLAEEAVIFILQIAVPASIVMVHYPVIKPFLPFLAGKGNRPAPVVVI